MNNEAAYFSSIISIGCSAIRPDFHPSGLRSWERRNLPHKRFARKFHSFKLD